MNEWVKTKKLTKANSYMVQDTIFWIGKKLNSEKPASLYYAYLYPQGVVVRGEVTKDKLKLWLDEHIDRIEAKVKAS